METIGVIHSGQTLEKILRPMLEKAYKDGFVLRSVHTTKEIKEFVRFEFPELIVVDFSDPRVQIHKLVSILKDDNWMHSFGVIGLYDPTKKCKNEILHEAESLNLIHLIEKKHIREVLPKVLHLIKENSQMLFMRDVTDKFKEIQSGSVVIDNDPREVHFYASIIAINLLNRGYITEEMKKKVKLVLVELIMNAIEHGNCGISHEEKQKFLEKDGDIMDLIRAKCQTRKVAKRKVHVTYNMYHEFTEFVIEDEGDGFDWRNLPDPLSRIGKIKLHGRGLFIARKLISNLRFNNKGNIMSFDIAHNAKSQKQIPEGFQKDKVVQVRAGDVVIEEGAPGNFLYYIVSGEYEIRSKNKVRGLITPQDMFMGEMSFLLGNRRTAEVRAKTDGMLVKISKKSFVSVIKEYPHYGIFLSKLMARRLAKVNEGK